MYQRGGGLWPKSAKVYFLDTILERYPFPKLYFYQIYDKMKKKPLMEIVDGQQRILTILEFVNGGIKLSKSSKNFSGKSFEDLDEELQQEFLMYRVPVDVILAAERPQLLEMFRRMNAYTAPLNPAEKRHVKFQGQFKWFIVELADKISPLLENFGIVTTKQLIRMGDAELLAELVVILEKGLVNKTEKDISLIYKQYNEQFTEEESYEKLLLDFFSNVILEHLSEFKNSLLMKTYAMHSLFAVYAHQKIGIPNGERDLGFRHGEKRFVINNETIEILRALVDAHETKDLEGDFKKYVNTVVTTTTKATQRKNRSQVFADIFCK